MAMGEININIVWNTAVMRISYFKSMYLQIFLATL